MLSEVVASLRCPLCSTAFVETAAGSGTALRCSNNHSFDVARQGYVNLAPHSPHTGDTAEMIAARIAFLSAGHYDFITAALVDAAVRSHPAEARLVIDAGSGTGRHLAAVLDALPDHVGLSLDVSKAALRRGARVHPRMAGALCDVWQRLPLADHSAGLILSVFAPRNGSEFHRVLSPRGALLVVTPAADHLAELVDTLSLLTVDPDKDKAVASTLGDRFEKTSTEPLQRTLHLTHEALRNLVGMGPSAFHQDPPAQASAIAALPDPLPVTASVHITTYRPLA